jgi:hypothetical protein
VGGSDAGAGGTGGGADPPPEPDCVTASDCELANGVAACGAWVCSSNGTCHAVSEGCTDADGDGYGVGTDCTCGGLDCNDAEPRIRGSARETCGVEPGERGGCFTKVRFCRSGLWGECRTAPGEIMPGGEACNGEDEDCDGVDDNGLGEFSCGIGACRTTVPACSAGVLGTCLPRMPRTNVDDCNDVDDDCDGAVDEDCRTCVRVSPLGDDVLGTATLGASPFRSLQAAIDFADAHRDVSPRVCVAAGAECGAIASYPGPSGAPLTMRNGISVLANYESTSWTRCAISTTTLRPSTPEGVLFPATLQSETVLDGFTIVRVASPTTAGVTIDGARQALLSNLTIENAPVAERSYGVNLIGGGDATIFRSRIVGGNGSVESIGVRSIGSRVSIEDNCGTIDVASGRCTQSCSASGPTLGPVIMGSRTVGSGTTTSVLFQDSPRSKIERSLLCNQSGASEEPDRSTGVTIRGASQGTSIHSSSVVVYAADSMDVVGVLAETCDGATPWLVDNHSIHAQADGDDYESSVTTIDALGDCHPVIDSNVNLTSSTNVINGSVVHCGTSGDVASRCVVSGNPRIVGGSFRDGENFGVYCWRGGCSKISRNGIVGLASGGCGGGCDSGGTGILLGETGAWVDRNTVAGGCGNSVTAIRASDAWARVQNNLVEARPRGCSHVSTSCWVRVLSLFSSSTDEITFHSNQLMARDASCNNGSTSVFEPLTPPSARGMFRNNHFDLYRYSLGFSIGSGALVFERNLFYNYIEWFSDDQGNLTIDSDLILPESRNRGTTTGAPLWDFDGNPRDAQPDIGPYERN